MHLKRFSGPSVPDVMRRIRQELGPEAVILHTRAQPGRGVLRFVGGRGVEILAAVDTPARAGGAAPAPPAAGDLDAEAAALRERLVRGLGARPAAPARGPVALRLAAAGLDEDLALRLAGATVAGGGVAGLAAALGRVIRVAGSPLGPRSATVTVLGPPGAGKTATLAKLAAHAHLRGGVVRLLSADAGSLGAPSALGAFARILGVPYDHVTTPAEAARATRGAGGLILLDTPGTGTRQPDAFAAASALARGAGSTELHLVVDATAQAADLRRVVQAGRAAGASHLLVTRVDETEGLGTLVAVAAEAGLPLSYLGTGRVVPDDLEPASLESVASRLLTSAPRPPAPDREVAGARRSGVAP